jgi:hypothetical protein
VLTKVAADQTVTLSQANAQAASATIGCRSTCATANPLFADVTTQVRIDWRHRENTAYDFDREPLMPHFLSDRGPAIAVGDVNGDGLDDIYAGGAKWQPASLWLQQSDGTFRESEQAAFKADSLAEDVDAAFFDANGDGRLDLYVVSGGYEFSGSDAPLQDRLYINDGRGTFARDASALPTLAESGSSVAVGDFNGDGHPDLFVGRRAVMRAYGKAPRSVVLQNDGKGKFRDVTNDVAPDIALAGMVTAGAWIDYDSDGRLDLVVTGEWMPVRVFRQENGRFVERTQEAGLTGTNGWWNTITVADVNGDRRQDLVLGNLGLNSYLTATPSQPARLYVADFARSGTSQPILTSFRGGKSYPLAGRDELMRALPEVRTRYSSYADFAGRTIDDMIPASERKRATILQATHFATSVALNAGNGRFELRALPNEAQMSTVDASLATDFDGDGLIDLLLAGNDYGVPPVLGRYDASYGLVLRGRGDGSFQALDLRASGLVLDGQVRHIKAARRAGGGTLIVVARNDDKLQVLRVSPPSSSQSRP